MEREERTEFARKLCELAEKEGLSLNELIEKVELGVTVLKLWKEAGKGKLPEEVLRADIAELVQEIQRLRGNPK